MKTLAEIRKEREAAALRRQAEKELKEATGLPGKVSLLKVPADTGFAIRPVHDLELSLDLLYHTYNGDVPCSEICHEHYEESCIFCNTPSSLYGKRFATSTKFLLCHVYNLVGKEFEFTDKTTNEIKKGNYNPLKLVAHPIGKKDIYIKPFLAQAKRGEFTDSIFLIKRVRGSGWEVPEVINEQELKDLLGPELPLALPTEYAKYNQMDKRNLWKLMLSALPSARVNDLLGPEPVKDQTDSKAGDRVIKRVVNPFTNSAADIDEAFE